MIFWTFAGLFFFCLVFESLTSWIFITRSRKNHPKLWHHAGCPTLIGNGDLIRAWSLNKYLLFSRFEELTDRGAVQFARKMRVPVVGTYFFTVGLAPIAFVIMIVFHP